MVKVDLSFIRRTARKGSWFSYKLGGMEGRSPNHHGLLRVPQGTPPVDGLVLIGIVTKSLRERLARALAVRDEGFCCPEVGLTAWLLSTIPAKQKAASASRRRLVQ